MIMLNKEALTNKMYFSGTLNNALVWRKVGTFTFSKIQVGEVGQIRLFVSDGFGGLGKSNAYIDILFHIADNSKKGFTAIMFPLKTTLNWNKISLRVEKISDLTFTLWIYLTYRYSVLDFIISFPEKIVKIDTTEEERANFDDTTKFEEITTGTITAT